MRKRQNRIVFYLDDKELKELNEKVNNSGLSRESFLRKMIDMQQIKEFPPIEFYDVMIQLSQINNSLNQIAVKAHKLNFIDAPEYRKNYEVLQSLVGKIIQSVF